MCNPELENVFIELVVKTEIRKEKHRGEGEDSLAREIGGREREKGKKRGDTKAEVEKQIIMDLVIGFILWLHFCFSDFFMSCIFLVSVPFCRLN